MKTENHDNLIVAGIHLIELALSEDLGEGDPTSSSIFTEGEVTTAYIRAKKPGVIAGLPIAQEVFSRVDPNIIFTPLVDEGQPVITGEKVAQIKGRVMSLLSAERVALNFLQRMSGIATITAVYVDAVSCSDARILDTRKTCPGHRILDKYAVRMGGGTNHRMNLAEMALVKDNHIDSVGGIRQAVEKIRAFSANLPIEIEVRTLSELHEALSLEPPIDRILLDNMNCHTLRQAVAINNSRVILEASGNVGLENIGEIAAAGVDYISVGQITHSAEALDLSMKVDTQQTENVQKRKMIEHIRTNKRRLGKKAVILAHHYQRDEIVELGDFRGDSLELVRSAEKTDAEYIVFCGVRFMAETAAILARNGQRVLLPEQGAGCYLADTATEDDVRKAWSLLSEYFADIEKEITPITYVNSSATLKAFCGSHGGYVCTSANASRVLRKTLDEKPLAFFFPDQHLGRNTAADLGIMDSEILVWNCHYLPSPADIQKTRVILWPGACNVHKRFQPEHIDIIRKKLPDVKIIVHPECIRSVVQLADETGSTSAIIKRVNESPPGIRWAIGTETRLVKRLQRENPDKTIVSLAPVAPYCPTMSYTTLTSLGRVLEGLVEDHLHNEVKVDSEIATNARLALERMLSL